MDDFLKGIEIKIMQLAKNKEYDTEDHKAPSTCQKVMHRYSVHPFLLLLICPSINTCTNQLKIYAVRVLTLAFDDQNLF